MRPFPALVIFIAMFSLAASLLPVEAQVQTDGGNVFSRACATCHQTGQTQIPTPEALRAFTPEAIVNALTNGKMSQQGSALSAAERT